MLPPLLALPSPRRCARLALVAAVLLVCTACLEHVEALRTRIRYDPYAQTFDVERRLIGVEPRFLGCRTVEDCVAAVERALGGDSAPTLSTALSDRLLQRLRESGATDIEVRLEPSGDRLDVVIRYRAPVGTAAADDTLVRVEWSSNGWPFGHYYLVVSAQESISMDGRRRTRKVPRAGPAGTDWIEEWVLPRSCRSVETTMRIGDPDETVPLFEAVPGLADALRARGWLDVPVAVADAGTDADAALAAAEPIPAAAPAGPVEARADPSSPAKTWVYEARVTGAGLTPALAAVAIEPLIPSLSSCYQRRQQEVPELEGSVFLSALVKGDGSVLATSVSGGVTDRDLLACLDGILTRWRFAPWGDPDSVSDVAIPVVFRVEPSPARARRP